MKRPVCSSSIITHMHGGWPTQTNITQSQPPHPTELQTNMPLTPGPSPHASFLQTNPLLLADFIPHHWLNVVLSRLKTTNCGIPVIVSNEKAKRSLWGRGPDTQRERGTQACWTWGRYSQEAHTAVYCGRVSGKAPFTFQTSNKHKAGICSSRFICSMHLQAQQNHKQG